MKRSLLLFALFTTSFLWADTIEVKKIMLEFEEVYKTDSKKALVIITKAEKKLSDEMPDAVFSYVLRRKGDAYVRASQLDSARLYFDKCEKYIRKDNYQEMGDLLNSRSNTFSRSGDLKGAIEQLLKAISYYEKAGILKKKWAVLQNLAICYAQSGLLEKAKEYFLEEIDILKDNPSFKAQVADVETNIGVVYDMTGKPDSALYMYQQAYDKIVSNGPSPSLAMLLNNMGAVSLKMKKAAQGIDYLKKGMGMLHQTGDMDGYIMATNNLADVFYTEGNVGSALDYGHRALQLADSLGYSNHRITSLDLLAKTYSKKGDFEKAYYYCRMNKEASDSLKNNESMKAIAEMEAKYESDKKEKEIELLNKDKELQQSQLSREKNFRYSLLGISALIVIVAVLLFVSLRQKQRTNRELDLKNKKIETAYSIIEEKQKEILDSIHYARRIQRSLLPNEKMVGKILRRLNQT